MLNRIMIKSAFLVVACCMSLVAHARADAQTQINVAPGELAAALESLSKQVSVELVYQPEQIKDFRTKGLKGVYTTEAAVRLLLKGTPLELQVDPSGAMLIAPPGEGHHSNDRISGASGEGQGNGSDSATGVAKEGKKSSSQDFRVAQTSPGQVASPATVNQAAQSPVSVPSAGLEEIVVTAEKRSEKLLDVPASVGVLTGDQLESLGVNSLTDLAGYVPGLSITSHGAPGANQIVIRGIATTFLNLTGPPTVATYIDDVAVGSATNGAEGAAFGLDLMPYDLERIEVLEGPQGTLYGADAMGGVVRYVLRKPDLDTFDARVGSSVENIDGGGTGWGVRSAVNLPLISNTMALLLSGYDKHNAGWLNNLGTGVSDANSSTQSGGRASLLWRPADGLSIQTTWLAQENNAADLSTLVYNPKTMQSIFGPQSTYSYFPQPVDQQTRLASIVVDWDVVFATITSVSSWSHLVTDSVGDVSLSFGPFTPGHPDALGYDDVGDEDTKLSQEIRIASHEDQKIQWMLGSLYTKENFGETQNAPTFSQSYVPLGPDYDLLISNVRGAYKEWAVYGNGTVKLTNQFDVSAGLRYASNTQSGFVAQSAGVFGQGSSSETTRPYQGKVTWMTNARYHLDQDTMVYARVATGYRPGGGCSSCGNPNVGVPNYYYPDTITSYEVGFKGQLLEHRLQFSSAVFYIDWQNIQLTEYSDKGVPYTGNGGTAASKGVELTTTYSFTPNFQLGVMLDYTDANLTADVYGPGGTIVGKTGDQLPSSARWTSALFANYSTPLADHLALLLSADYRYRDKVYSQFASSTPPGLMGPQNLVGASAGLSIRDLELRLYGKNVFNNRSLNGLTNSTLGGSYAQPGLPFAPVQPRTIGLSADYRF